MPRRKRILIVEDDPGVLEVMAFVLERRYDILVASRGVEALDLIARERIDLVLADWLLPDMAGADFLRAIRTTLPDLPVITMSGLRADATAREARAAGATAHMGKPLDIQELLDRIEVLLGDSEYRQEGSGSEPRAHEPAPSWTCEAVKGTLNDGKAQPRRERSGAALPPRPIRYRLPLEGHASGYRGRIPHPRLRASRSTGPSSP